MKKFVEKYREQIMYLLFGIIVTLLNWITYALLVTLTEIGVTLSNGIAWIVAVVSAFVTNKKYVFDSGRNDAKGILREAGSFLLSRVMTGIFEVLMPTFLISIGLNHTLFGIDGFFAKLFVSIIVVISNYILSKLIVFKK